MKKLMLGAAVSAGLALATASPAVAGPSAANGNACEALNAAHITIIEAQGLERHLTLGVHTQAFSKLLARCAAG